MHTVRTTGAQPHGWRKLLRWIHGEQGAEKNSSLATMCDVLRVDLIKFVDVCNETAAVSLQTLPVFDSTVSSTNSPRHVAAIAA